MPKAAARSATSPDLAQADDAELPTRQVARSGDACPVGIGRVRAVVLRRRVARGLQLLDADQARALVDLAREREHECHGVLGARDVGPPPQGKHPDAGLRAGPRVYVR
ncbi:MAG: hypothetical protein ACRET6_02585, partial [Burkholderiales bacterium]